VQFFDVNILAILAAAVTNIIISIVWYSPNIFGKAWMSLTGKKKEEHHVASFFSALIAAYVLALLVEATSSNSIEAGALLGILVGLGFAATSTAVNFLSEKRPTKLYLIAAGHHLIAYIFMGVILGNLA
jgi:surface polysaccharide O-acyltransferase-like enzyme